MSNRFNKAALLTGSILAGAMVATPVYAQNDGDDEAALQSGAAAAPADLIVVTGSRIAQRNVETAAPIAVVQDEEFKLSGTVNVENVVNTLPQVVPGFTSNSNNPGTGTATLNLRGLGSTRTMVLVNGRRWMFYDTAQVVDLNTIPNFLLDSVDVVTGGASAVYGSDALAGVVNFRLKDVEGIELGGQYSLTQEGDGARYQIHGAIGTSFDDGRGSATVYAEYYNRQGIFQGDRDFSFFALGGETFGVQQQQFGSSTLPNGVLRYLGGANTPTNVPAGSEFGPAGRGFGSAVVFDDTPGDFRRRTGDTYNYAPVNYLQIPQERYLMGGYADYEFADGHEAYMEVSMVNNRVATELAATPVTGTFNINLAAVQPFFVPGDFQQLVAIDQAETANNAGGPDDPGVVNMFVQRRTVETGARNSLDERNAFRVLGGVRGSITDWLNYDSYYMYARTRNANVQEGNISRSAFQRGLDGTDPAINIFGLGTLTPAMVDQISIRAQNGDISTLEVANASLSGFVGDLGFGGGDIGFAVGAEYREVASQFIPDTALASGDVIGFNAGNPTEGGYNVREIFAELNVPVFETDGGTRLELTGAGRYSDYSLAAVGGVWTYAGGVEFGVIDGVTLRGQYQRAVRAPNVGELFGGQSIGFPGATDPCGTAAATPGSALGNICVASGVPTANLGNPTQIQPNAQIPALFGGNPNLQEETSDSFTAGIVLQPTFIPGLTITADYFDIQIDDAISTISLQQTLDLCFNQIQDPNATSCAPFFPNGGTLRNPSGAIVTGNPPALGALNVASLGVKGVDLQVNYTTTIPFSLMTDTGEQTVNLNFLGTWTDSAFFEAFPGADVIECAGQFGQTCGEPTASYKWTSRLSFVDGPLTTSVRWRHLSGVADDDDSVDYAAFNGVERIPAYDLFDLTFSFDVTEQFTLAMGVNNLLDKLPQAPEFAPGGIVVTNANDGTRLGDNQEQANTYPSTYDVLGRDFFVSANFKF
ncbi:MAG: TonB-dependent receptor [Erythrobacter sp.]|nr:TonB-dependent receptor [Erythrobacter sp.]